MEISICYLYYDLLNVYGDRGNILILKKVMECCGIKCNINHITVGDSFDFSKSDILFVGGGQDYDQKSVITDMNSRKESIQKHVEDGKTSFFIGGAYQLLGKRYITSDGDEIDGVGIFDIYTEKGNKRFTGDIVIDCDLLKTNIIGYENHSGRTYINNYKPFGNVLYGHGNNGKDGTEGIIYKNSICTYMHGCCLAKNPELTKYIISNAIMNKYHIQFDAAIDDEFSLKARNSIIKKYQIHNK